ncbi:transcriptional regulator family: Fungal Specific TF [Penicillium roqueforti]|nr:transcriptional regulator family: Fungal Specific TF [Penicillium roqueforti]KAI2701093.1 transcriptional regulator family: Fungal Specific TF [Penicillium roqueforti]KAI2736829.1 transcriptional regulator family: Fungal Specific TF [Penicillium roqueforti]KAI2739095.1 transcriptional regulator family: Fungal Specific TF [Penicillium roqueforti]KAI2771910.1 transcriptional regulator family: Fungal Specific TF [Penicillium roqueforti]
MSFNANWSDNQTDNERPAKVRRIARACLQCHTRKQRCLPSDVSNLQLPCKRCQRLSITCSFETDRAPTLDLTQSPSGLVQLVIELQNRLNQHETRISELENQKSPFDHNTKERPRDIQPEHQEALPKSQSNIYDSPESEIDGIHLGPPIATLRSLRVLAEERVDESTLRAQRYKNMYDPIYQGLLTAEEVRRAVEIFFDHCHHSAPVLDEGIRDTWHEYLQTSPTLILTICSVGTRFWDIGDRTDDSIVGHPRFYDLTKLLDKAVSRLLLRPTPSDVNLDSICVLLLYAQWMPCSKEGEDEDSLRPSTYDEPQTKSRYNEISAWVVLGLAERYSALLGLEQSATSLFKPPDKVPSIEDVKKLRVWYNLLTCNFNLMLTSGLPASIDPTPSVQVAWRFVSHELMQSPADLRILVFSFREIRIPLQSFAIHFGPVVPTLPQLCIPCTTTFFPTVSLTAAAQIILAQSSFKPDIVFSLDSQELSTFPGGTYNVDRASVSRLYYAVDSTWISHTFAIIFLCLCYIRGIIDENLQICSEDSSQEKGKLCTRLPSSSSSVLARLLLLAIDIFDSVSLATRFHFAHDFQAIVHYTVALVLISEKNEQHIEETEIDDMAIQSLLDLMNDSGVDWAGNLFGESLDFPELNMDGMLS